MSRQALFFYLHPYRIQATYYTPRNRREGSHPQRLEFLCESPVSTFQAVLHNDTSFLYFDSLSHFFSYLRRNRKKKEIVEFDGRGYLSFHVGSNEGYQGIQPINLIQSCKKTQQAVRIETYTRDYEEKKEILVQTLKKAFRTYMQQRNRVTKMRKNNKIMGIKGQEGVGDKSPVIFSLPQANQEHMPNAYYHLSPTSPIYEFQVSLTSITQSPFKLRVQKLECQYLAIGIRYTIYQPNQEIRHIFNKDNGEIQQGDEISVCWSDTFITFHNHTKNQLKPFPKPHAPIQTCTVFLSLVSPQ